MSTSLQVYNDYYYYVCTYIANKLNTSNINVLEQLDSTAFFTLKDDGDGKIYINTWNVASVTQPQLSDLMLITNANAIDSKNAHKPVKYLKGHPEMVNILLDIYNKLGLLGQNYTKQSLLAYLKSVM